MSQTSIGFSPAWTGRVAWDAQLEILRACVDHLTSKEVCDVIDIGKSMLSQALSPHHDKLVDPLWIHQIKAMLARRYDKVSQDLLRKLCEQDVAVTTLVVGEPVSLTPEQENVELKRELARLEGGTAALDRVRSLAKVGR